jgi:hypothetical protein
MQLSEKKSGRIGQFIAQASLALVCATSVAHAQENLQTPSIENKGYFSRKADAVKKWAKWSGEFGVLYYSETEGRVQAIEPATTLSAAFEGDRIWTTKLVLDSLTGSSPNGAIKSNQPQTFTGPSGKYTYTTQPKKIPLDDSFKDTRVNIATSWSQPLSRLLKISTGLNLSNEYDYFSAGVNTSITRETEDKNRSYSLGLSYTNDQIKPVGGTPIPLATMVAPASTQPKNGTTESKDTFDLLAGFSQVMSRTWIMLTNLSLGQSDGYMNDPYKIVTIYDGTAGATLGDPQSYIYEKRPDSRLKQSLYVASKNYISSGVVTSSYRYTTDDWDLKSHTLQVGYNFPVSAKWRLEPSFRYYTQSAVDFYDFAIADNEALPRYVTADNRLGEMTTLTPAIKFIRKLKNERDLSLLLQYYQQTGDSSPSGAVGTQVGQDLFPDVTAYAVQVNYSF